MLFLKSFFWLPGLIGVLVYLKSLGYSSAWGDDTVVIAPYARDFNLMIKTFYDTPPGSHFFPFSFLQCFIINSIFGDFAFPFGFRLYALVLHAITCTLATLIFYKITANKLASILIISLWATHPINVETVTRLVCSPAHLPAATFSVAFLYLLLKFQESKNNFLKSLFLISSSFFFLASVTSYEQYILFPIVALSFLLRSDKLKCDKSFALLISTLALFYLIYVAWRYFACGRSLFYAGGEFVIWHEVGDFNDIVFRIFWLAPQLIVHYLRLFFYPDYLAETKADWYMLGGSVWSPYSLFCQAFTLSLIVFTFLLRKKIPLFSIGIFWFLISMFPIIQIVPLFTIVDEHYCYLSTLGISLSLLSILINFPKIFTRKVLIIVFVPLLCLFLFRTSGYISTGKDHLTHLIAMTNESPLGSKLLLMYQAITVAKLENRQKDLPAWISENNIEEETNKWIKKYLNARIDLSYKFGPMQMPYKYNTYGFVSQVLYLQKRYNELDILIKQALALKNDSYGWYKTAEFFNKVKQWKLGWESIKKAIELNPNFSYLYNDVFLEAAVNSDDFYEAERIIKNYIKNNPTLSHPYLIAGYFYMLFGKKELALANFLKGISKEKIPSINNKKLYIYASDYFLRNVMIKQAKKALSIVASFDPFDKDVKKKLLQIS